MVKPEVGIASRIFRQKTVGPDGKPIYKDNGDWGSFIGELNASGERHGQGTMVYESGSVYAGAFANDKYSGSKGVFTWSDGDEHEGEWKDGERTGKGIFRKADGSVEYSIYIAGSREGAGVMWSADRKTATKLMEQEYETEISLPMAEKMAKEKFNWPVPEPSTAVPTPSANVPTAIKNLGFIGTLFSNKKVGPAGKMHYKSGNCYEGGFVDDKFQGDKGVYRWVGGDAYVGPWKDGERNGKACFKTADGTKEYSLYENGQAKGDGVSLSGDGKTAHTLLDGEKKLEILVNEAESIIKEKWGLAD